uniref:Uncharacterized protein n=1 Tax=Megaselia scalaris TaxID=36166 RepID=T1H452_MEGSC
MQFSVKYIHWNQSVICIESGCNGCIFYGGVLQKETFVIVAFIFIVILIFEINILFFHRFTCALLDNPNVMNDKPMY